jgi:TRAP-type C4-dicarboxylate transport system substrate-binding protein
VPIQLGFTETYLGIRQGIVNAVTLPVSLLRSTKFTEVAPYIVEIREFPQTWPMMISERSWARLSPAERDILVRAANEAGTFYAKTTVERAQSDIDEMIRVNHAVVSKPDLAPFRARMQPLYNELIAGGTITQALFDAVNSAGK